MGLVNRCILSKQPKAFERVAAGHEHNISSEVLASLCGVRWNLSLPFYPRSALIGPSECVHSSDSRITHFFISFTLREGYHRVQLLRSVHLFSAGDLHALKCLRQSFAQLNCRLHTYDCFTLTEHNYSNVIYKQQTQGLQTSIPITWLPRKQLFTIY